MVIQRGEIWWADLPEPTGSEPGFRRPVLIVQSDDFNSQVLTVDKSYLTEKISDLPNYLLEQVEAGLRLVMDLD